MWAKLLLFFIIFAFSSGSFGSPEEFYEKPEILNRMEKREVISVVKIIPHSKQSEKVKVLDMKVAGLVEGVSLYKSMDLMADYENLQRVAPDYIKLSKLIVKKGNNNQYQKYLHMKNEVKTLLGVYKIEIYAKVWEEKLKDKGFVHWEIIHGSTIGRKNAPGDFVGLKGDVQVIKHIRQKGSTSQSSRGVGGSFYRSRPQKEQIMMIFKGRLERDEAGMSKVIPNFILQFAMEVALQRVGILLRNYLETAKDVPVSQNLEDLAKKEEKHSLPSPASH